MQVCKTFTLFNLFEMEKWFFEFFNSKPFVSVVPKMMISGPDDENATVKGGKPSGSDALFKNFREIHERFPSTTATPRGYLNFIRTYLHLFNQKKENIENKQKHLQVRELSKKFF